MLKNVKVGFLQRKCVKLLKISYKHKEAHWSVVAKKKQATDKALNHFDDFYKKVFDSSWSWIRQALLAEKKYVALVNNYSDSEQIMSKLENNGALNLRTLFNLEKRYIKERHEEEAKNIHLETIHKIDAELELANEKETHDAVRNYQNTINLKELSAKQKYSAASSVEESLKTAEIDYSRIVSPGSTDLSSALYEFVPATKLKGKEDWIPETQHYKYYETSNEFNVKVEKEYDLHFPESLNVYSYEKSNYTPFESPRRGTTDVMDYYLLDGASVLPVLALGLKPGDRFLDMCCAPGGKTIVALQTLYPDLVVCNDVEYSRVNRIQNVLKQYLYDFDEKWLSSSKLKITQEDGRFIAHDLYDCILVDAPCTNDRLSVHENDNNWFKSSRTKERLQLPEVQAALLSNALKLVRVGGTVVYSTCSLSPVQNDGIVNMALRKIWEESDINIVVRDMTPALKVAKCMFRFADKHILRYGHLVLPYLPHNYGPLYFCKMIREK